jgi:hypothetical protein
VSGGFEAFADVGGAAVLPDESIANWLAGFAVPQDCGFALVGDTDGGNILGLCVGSGERFQGDPDLRRRNLLGIVFHPTGLGKYLIELALRDGSHFAIAIEQERSRTGRALIECQNVLHDSSSNAGVDHSGSKPRSKEYSYGSAEALRHPKSSASRVFPALLFSPYCDGFRQRRMPKS